jgi:hypothetical protein
MIECSKRDERAVQDPSVSASSLQEKETFVLVSDENDDSSYRQLLM